MDCILDIPLKSTMCESKVWFSCKVSEVRAATWIGILKGLRPFSRDQEQTAPAVSKVRAF